MPLPSSVDTSSCERECQTIFFSDQSALESAIITELCPHPLIRFLQRTKLCPPLYVKRVSEPNKNVLKGKMEILAERNR